MVSSCCSVASWPMASVLLHIGFELPWDRVSTCFVWAARIFACLWSELLCAGVRGDGIDPGGFVVWHPGFAVDTWFSGLWGSVPASEPADCWKGRATSCWRFTKWNVYRWIFSRVVCDV